MKALTHGCGHHAVRDLPQLKDRLRRVSRRITGPREAILKAMKDHPHPMLVKEIHAALGPSHCDLVTVYRSMQLLEGMGMVKRVDFGKGAARFELLGENDDGHHHHLVCTACDAVFQLEDCLLQGVDERIASASGFKGITHRLEFFGLCPKCQISPGKTG